MILPLSELVQRATVRLIPTAYFKPPVLAPLVDSDAELEALAALEGLTNQRLAAEKGDAPDIDPRELAYQARAAQLQTWGHTYINAAFAYTREGGNRFNGPGRGAWYCAFDDLTAIEEVAFHRTRELTFIDHFHDEMAYVSILADFIGDFPDLRRADPPPQCLDSDPGIGYPAGQKLAGDLREAGQAGVIYPSLRRPGGTCFAAFEPQIIQNPRPGAKWTLRWDGSPAFTVVANPE